MNNKPNISVEPLTFGMTGFKVDDLMSTKFLEQLRKETPSAVVAYVVIGFTDSKEIVTISHDRDHDSGKFKFDRVDVEGSEPISIAKVKETLVQVFS